MRNSSFNSCVPILIILMIISLCISSLLLWEYRFFCEQTAELQIIKNQYQSYIHMLQQKISAQEVITANHKSKETHSDEDQTNISSNIDVPSIIIDGEQCALPYTKQSPYSHQSHTRPTKKVSHLSKNFRKAARTKNIKKDMGLLWPIDREMFWLSSFFGPRKRTNGALGFHHGIDMAAARGTVVKAARKGTVLEAGFQKGYGNNVLIQHTNTLKTRYAHLQKILVRKGQLIEQGIPIGTVGDTGFIRKKSKDGSHLHFEVYEGNERINPLHCLSYIT